MLRGRAEMVEKTERTQSGVEVATRVNLNTRTFVERS
jgi:hypothetical protein